MEIGNSSMRQGLFVSIVIPVYNVEKYLEECLNSILNQTYTDYELILVDDGSWDRSGDICDSYAEMHDNIHVFHQSNQGQAAARNLGVEKAKSDWIMFVDSDDVAHPQLLEFFVQARNTTGARIVACLREEGTILEELFFKTKVFTCCEKKTDEKNLLRMYKEGADYYWALFPSLIEKKVYQKNPMTPGKIYEDNAVCCKWLVDAEKITVIEEVLYFYRQNPTGTMNQKFSVKQLDYLWALREQLNFYDCLNYKMMLNLVFEDYVGTAIWLSKEVEKYLNDKKLARNVLRECAETCKNYKGKVQCYSYEIEKLNKYAHPMKYKFLKKMRLITGRIQ